MMKWISKSKIALSAMLFKFFFQYMFCLPLKPFALRVIFCHHLLSKSLHSSWYCLSDCLYLSPAKYFLELLFNLETNLHDSVLNIRNNFSQGSTGEFFVNYFIPAYILVNYAGIDFVLKILIWNVLVNWILMKFQVDITN